MNIENRGTQIDFKKWRDIKKHPNKNFFHFPNGDYWPVRRSDISTYDMVFYKALNRIGVESLQEEMELRRKNGDLFILDLMSYGACNRKLEAPGVVVGLSDNRSKKETEKDEEIGTTFIKGDVKAAATWRQIREIAEEQQREFSLIVSCPLAGSENLPLQIDYYTYCFKQLYGLLSADNGILAIEVNPALSGTIKEKVHKLNCITGIFSASESYHFALRKTQHAPERVL